MSTAPPGGKGTTRRIGRPPPGASAAAGAAGAAGGAAAEDASGPLPESYAEARASVFAFLRGGIAQLQERGMVRAGDASAMALSAWALMHGLTMLTLDGQVARAGETPPEELALTATNLMMFGMDAGR
jgi:hypothetical protein